MPEYQIFRLNRRVLVSWPERREFEADEQAVRHVSTLLEGCDVVEVWAGNRLAAEVRPAPPTEQAGAAIGDGDARAV